ncbi:hypothetical protein BVRB_6g137040 [Beta vulgaris subsp. vulgaris]|nr:hypothetical protein BVRB_6g137040 [Beta vulgaris subsp. vulgaris]
MEEETPKSEHPPTSTSDLMASAKIVAEAAQLACTQQTDKIDKAKVSEAAEEVLEAVKTYGKLDESAGVGQYVDKAQGYLHKMHASSEDVAHSGAEKEESDAPADAAEKDKFSGGLGGLMNMAKGLF